MAHKGVNSCFSVSGIQSRAAAPDVLFAVAGGGKTR